MYNSDLNTTKVKASYSSSVDINKKTGHLTQVNTNSSVEIIIQEQMLYLDDQLDALKRRL